MFVVYFMAWKNMFHKFPCGAYSQKIVFAKVISVQLVTSHSDVLEGRQTPETRQLELNNSGHSLSNG